MENITVLTGAGISAESGLTTFRDDDGFWRKYNVEDIATVKGLVNNPKYLLDFYNLYRKRVENAQPNKGHLDLVKLEEHFNVNIITQNVDDLHERAGSKNVLHVHGEIKKIRSSVDPNLIYDYDRDITVGDLCEKGSQLRPHVVFFGEDVPMYVKALELLRESDYFIVIGTSLEVSPICDLVELVNVSVPIYVVNPKMENIKAKYSHKQIIEVCEVASVGVEIVIDKILSKKI
jgi:NAD-dependent deacetylase